MVIPAYNEERRLGATLDEVAAFLRRSPGQWEVRVVDDGSATTGRPRLPTIAARANCASSCSASRIAGKVGRSRPGCWRRRGDFCFICDADLSMPIAEIVRFLPPVAPPFDVAIGSREGMAGAAHRRAVYRHLMGRLFNRGVRWLMLPGHPGLAVRVQDVHGRAVRSIFTHVTVDGWAFDVEVLSDRARQGLRVIEVPIEWHYRAESQINMMRDGWEMLKELLRIRLRAARGAYRTESAQ